MPKVVVIGGGAGGILAAGRAAECGAKVILLERNSVLGRKLRITGKGRGNVTNTAGLDEFIAAFGPNGKFLYGAFSRFSNQDLIGLLERLGVPTKIERGGRVFPASDRAADVAAAFEAWLRGLGVEVRTGVRAQGLGWENGTLERRTLNGNPQSAIRNPKLRITGVRVFSGTIPADAVVLATGGITYPRTGSTGDGYRMAAEVEQQADYALSLHARNLVRRRIGRNVAQPHENRYQGSGKKLRQVVFEVYRLGEIPYQPLV